jgi:hypothetical protein
MGAYSQAVNLGGIELKEPFPFNKLQQRMLP